MISMGKGSFKVILMVFFLGFSYLPISSAATRSLMSNTEPLPASVQDLLAQNVRKLSEAEEMVGEYLRHVWREERMLMESTYDYPPTGANTKHDPPRSPVTSP